jgi:CRP-like cAMP-binding protein
LHVIRQGWAARLRQLGDGVRQIVSIYLPGDVCEAFWLEDRAVVQPVIALSNLHVASVPVAAVRRRASDEPAFRDALWHEAQRTAEARSEWMVSLARRDSVARLAHVFCEILARQQANGDASGNCCDLPLTQQDLADLAGITPVHTNRTLQTMRARGLIELRGKRLRVLDLDELKSIASFDGYYLPRPGEARIGEMLLAEATPEKMAASPAPQLHVHIPA